MKYASIVYLQESEADEALDILKSQGPEAAMQHLAQWDYGEYHDVRDKPLYGADDDTFRSLDSGQPDYILSWNSRMGTIGLELVLEDKIDCAEQLEAGDADMEAEG